MDSQRAAPRYDLPGRYDSVTRATGNPLGVRLQVGGAEKAGLAGEARAIEAEREDVRAAWLLTARALAEEGACGSLYSWLPNNASATISPATK